MSCVFVFAHVLDNGICESRATGTFNELGGADRALLTELEEAF